MSSRLVTNLTSVTQMDNPAHHSQHNWVNESVEARSLNVIDWGAAGDGVADDTASITAAITAAGAAGGGIVYLPAGTYKVSTLGTLPDFVSLVGAGSSASIIACNSATNTIITTGHASSIRDLKFAPSVTRTSGFDINVQGNQVTIRDCYFVNYYICINVGTDAGTIRVGTRVQDCNFNGVARSGSGCMQWMQYGGGFIDGCIISGPSSGTQPDFGIRLRNGDTILISNMNVTLHGYGLVIDTPSSRNTFATTIVNSFFDSSGVITGGANASSAIIAPSGGCYDTKISNTWFGISSGAQGLLVQPAGAGVMDGLTLTGCEFVDNSDCGVIVVGSGSKNWSVIGGLAAGNGTAGIRAAGATTNFSIIGVISGNVAGRGANGRGILIDNAAEDYYVITNNLLVGNTTAGITDSGTGVNKFVQTTNIGT